MSIQSEQYGRIVVSLYNELVVALSSNELAPEGAFFTGRGILRAIRVIEKMEEASK